MNQAQINLSGLRGAGVPLTFAKFAAVIVLAVLTGCGKSEAQKKRDAGREKFKEAIASLKVCTGGSTYNEFRQATMNLRTSFEVNKSSLDDLLESFNKLDAVITASDYCWRKKSFAMGLRESRYIDKTELAHMQVLNPSILNNSKIVQVQNDPKASFTTYQIEDDPDLQTHRYVKLGLSRISELCERMDAKLKPE